MTLFTSKSAVEAVEKDRSDRIFSKALTKALGQEIKGLLFKRSERLLPFDQVKETLDLWFVTDRGIQSVPIDAIIGSQGRYKNFSRHFLPLDENLRTRWKNIEKAVSSGQKLPPCELYKVCHAYFVKDGHHRISVAKTKNKQFIDARVFEYECDVTMGKKTDPEQFAILETYHKFLKETGLKKSRNPDLHLTRLGGYQILMEHIERHKLFLEQQSGEKTDIKKAAESWYDHIYSPMADLIRKNRIMKHFPHRTETDFYIWIIRFRHHLTDHAIEKKDAANFVEEYAEKFATPFRKFLGKIKKKLGFIKY
ncbi:MAG: hypothetical protein U9P10_08365 [Thermodesulfobacteriota bacterium]|nr:hypothetical protein [Thermodesulfobacteriota bacterium]